MSLENPDKWTWLGRAAALATVCGVLVAAWQIAEGNRLSVVSRASEDVRYILSSQPMVDVATKISAKTDGGTDYQSVSIDRELKGNVNNYLNALEFVSTGVNRETHDEDVVCVHLARIIYKQANAHLFGRDGRLPTGIQWTAGEAAFPTDDDFPELRELYRRWFGEPGAEYRDDVCESV